MILEQVSHHALGFLMAAVNQFQKAITVPFGIIPYHLHRFGLVDIDVNLTTRPAKRAETQIPHGFKNAKYRGDFLASVTFAIYDI